MSRSCSAIREIKGNHLSLLLVNADSKPFWDGCRRLVLTLQRCSHCELYRYPPSPICPSCLSPDHRWIPASGQGTLFSFVTVHRALDPYWQGEIPYVVAVVELTEGPHLITNLVGIGFDRVEVGMALEVSFDVISDEIIVPRFRARRT
jgi:uncharacterized OB-fold protein